MISAIPSNRRCLAARIVLFAGLHLALIPGVASAQTVFADAVRQAQQIERDRTADARQRQLEKTRRDNRPPAALKLAPPKAALTPSDAACVPVETVTVRDVTLIPEARIRKITDVYAGECLGLSDLNRLLEQLTLLYVNKGYIASRAFLPEQELADGALEIVVVEGRLENIVFDGKPNDYTSEIRTAFPDLLGKPVNLRDIEQGLDQLNRLRTNHATIALEAGKAPGTSILSVTRNRRKKGYANLGFDNLGASSTGRYQSRIDLGVEDLLHLNDAWYFGYQRSMERNPLYFSDVPSGDNYSAGFSVPYGYWRFALDGAWGGYDSQIPGNLSAIDTSGLSRSVSVGLSRVVYRDHDSITSLGGKLGWKRTENFILGSRLEVSSRDLSTGTLELLHSRRLWGGQLLAATRYHQGLKLFGAFDDDNAPAGSPKGQFHRTDFSVAYFRAFQPGKLDISYSGELSGQYSPDLLFGSEQLSYGGYASLRGVRESVLFGNRGLLMRNELALQLPQAGDPRLVRAFGQIEAYAALDYARVFAQQASGIAGGSLTGASIGLRARGGRFGFDLSWSDIVASSAHLAPAVADSGLLYARIILSF